MALKRYIPIQDTYIISSSLGESNFGADELLELKPGDGNTVSRILLKFSSQDLQEIQPAVSASGFKATLHLYLSEAYNLPEEYFLVARTLQESWTEGFGREGDIPNNLTGATWKYRNENLDPWLEPGGDLGTIYDGRYAVQGRIIKVLDGDGAEVAIYEKLADGGNAYGLISGSSDVPTIYAWQQFNRPDRKDLDLDITQMVQTWVGEEANEGLLIAFAEEATALQDRSRVSFFSRNTHTIYRPYLQVSWDDSSFESSLPVVDPNYCSTSLDNFKLEYRAGDNITFRVGARPLYPARVFSTSSLYRTNYVLPETSYWGIKDEYTNEMVVDFDREGTKISADESGSFFRFDTSALEPDRYYRFLIQILTEGGSKVTVDNRNVFKVVRNGRYE